MPNSNEFNHKGPNIHTQKNVGLGLGKQPKPIPKKPKKFGLYQNTYPKNPKKLCLYLKPKPKNKKILNKK